MEIGKQSIRLEKPVYVESWASVVGKKEGEGPLAPFFDEIETDDQLGQDNWEEAESMLQQKAARLAIKKAGCYNHNIKVVKRRSYGSQSRLGNHQWAFLLSVGGRLIGRRDDRNSYIN